MVTALREADRTTVAEAAKKHKVSEATIYAWRKHFGQMDAADVKRLKALEQENSRLKKLLAMDDDAFARLTWSFAAELAWAARARRPHS